MPTQQNDSYNSDWLTSDKVLSMLKYHAVD